MITTADVNKILEQNYTNQLLYVVSKQIEGGSNKTIPLGDKPSSSKYSPNIETNPTFKIPDFSREKFPKLTDKFSNSAELLEKINDQLSMLKLTGNQSSRKLSIIHESKEQIKYVGKGRYNIKKNYYDKPSFPDMQFEENAFTSSSANDGGSIVEWNIDGLA